MSRSTFLAIFGLLLLCVAPTQAQVAQIQMHIDGYLCGN